jgi:N-acetylmuramoyl-L-alanine amidase
MYLQGKVSWFGGPDDMGVSPDEGLAFIYDVEQAPHLFLDYQPSGTTGLARRLNPDQPYIACRWDYDIHPKESLLQNMALVRSLRTGRFTKAFPADWGPHIDTDRVADISPGLMAMLGIDTDDEVEVIYPYDLTIEEVVPMPYERIVISSGHGLYVRGASGIIDEVDEARKVVDALAVELAKFGVEVTVFHDDVSKSQSENLNRIVDFHNDQSRDLDVSIHFNAYEQREQPVGTEVLYVTQGDLACRMSAAIAEGGGFIDRGGKYHDGLAFLNGTDEPSILVEVCFVDSEADCDLYAENFLGIIDAMASVLVGQPVTGVEESDGEDEIAAPPSRVASGRVDIEISGDVVLFVNGEQVTRRR